MHRIAMIASNEDLIELDMTEEEIAMFKDKIKIVYGHLSKSVSVARSLENTGVEVIVARGATVSYLRASEIELPIVELPITLKDISNALIKAKEISKSGKPIVGAIVYEHMMLAIEMLSPLLEVEIQCFEIKKEDDADKIIDKAFSVGIEVLMGGVLIYKAAQKRGLPVALIQSGRESFLMAVREAESVSNAKRVEQQRTGELNAILEYAYDGITAINDKGVISVFNSQAEKITGISAKDALKRLAVDVFPNYSFKESLENGEIKIDDLTEIGKAKVLISCIPIFVKDKITGIVATFQEVGQIERMEKKIRRSSYYKGFVARSDFDDILGESIQLKEVIRKTTDFAKTDFSILITGETGVGKELFAQSIHNNSKRCEGPFVAVNCAAIPENILESELFGYVEGAFTGAKSKGKKGYFELAHEGTIFLDEISEIPLSLQGRLLRIIQENEVLRLGHDRVIPINIRIICATNKNLKKLVDEKCFRDDLYWRLNVLNIIVPPLRSRQEDILLLIEYYLNKHHIQFSFSPEAIDLLESYEWPGNVRELSNFCERLIATSGDYNQLSAELVMDALDISDESLKVNHGNKRFLINDYELTEALKKTSGNKAEAAKILGVHRATVWRYLKKRGL